MLWAVRGLQEGNSKEPAASSSVALAPSASLQDRQQIIEVGHYGLHQEVEQLKRDKNVLMQEVIRLRQQQQDSNEVLVDLQDRLEMQEQRQQQMIGFLAAALQNPGLVQARAGLWQGARVELFPLAVSTLWQSARVWALFPPS